MPADVRKAVCTEEGLILGMQDREGIPAGGPRGGARGSIKRAPATPDPEALAARTPGRPTARKRAGGGGPAVDVPPPSDAEHGYNANTRARIHASTDSR